MFSFWSICTLGYILHFFFFKQKTAYEMRISDWSSDVCSSDLFETGDAAIQESEYTATLHADANPGYEVADVGPIHVGEITRNGTQIGRASCRERVCQYV